MELQPTIESGRGVMRVGATKHCCYGLCNSDSRHAKRDYMRNVGWLPFPKPKSSKEKCERWLRACGRQEFTAEKVKKWTYICTKHFIGGKGPTEEHPDPIPANFTVEQVNKMRKKRKPPKERIASSSKKLMVDYSLNDYVPSQFQYVSSEQQKRAKASLELFKKKLVSKKKRYNVQQMLLVRDNAHPEQGAAVDQQEPKSLNIKEELWTSLEGEQVTVKEETDASMFPVTAVHIKSEEEEKRLFSQLHQQEIRNIMEEQEELWTSLEGELVTVKEETDASMFPVTAVHIKNEEEEKPLFSQLHQQEMEDRDVPTSSSADQMKT